MKDVVITGLGAVTAHGFGFDAQWDALANGKTKASRAELQLSEFNAAPHLGDRRMMKAVSKIDAIGLAAVEGLAKAMAFAPGQVPKERVGLYVGAPPGSPWDNEYYVDSMNEAKAAGGAKAFGRTCMSSKPTTLLLGLPNNVLCYGALVLDARGPNSNYTASGLSGMMAVINGARRVRRGQLDLAVAGGFSAYSDELHTGMFASVGLSDLLVADAAAFVSLETRAGAAARGVTPVVSYAGGAMTSDGLGPRQLDPKGTQFERAIGLALADAGAEAQDIGLVLASATGSPSVDMGEFSVLSRVFAKSGACPPLGCSTPVMGAILEAGGVLELGLAAKIMAAGVVPPAMRAPAYASWNAAPQIDPAKPFALIVRTTAWGEHAAIVVKREQ